MNNDIVANIVIVHGVNGSLLAKGFFQKDVRPGAYFYKPRLIVVVAME